MEIEKRGRGMGEFDGIMREEDGGKVGKEWGVKYSEEKRRN